MREAASAEEAAMADAQHDVWAVGEGYERYVGRWSRLVAREFLAWLAVPAGREWFDLGCGTGALSQTILLHASPARVTGVDPSEGFLSSARAQITDPRAEFRQGDALAIPARDGAFAATVSGLVLNFIKDQAKAVAEMRRVTQPGGTVAAYVWDYAGEMQLMRHFWNAAVALNPATRELDEGIRFPMCRPEPLTALFSAAGMRDVVVKAIDVPTVFKDFDDYWSPFLGGQGPAPGYCTSLPEADRAALRERIRAGLPVAPDGSIPLIARAWAVRGMN
jgi:SAM-dependent methyltransferase